MTYRTLAYAVADRVATITLNRPERMNAINLAMPGEIAAAVDVANRDDGVHVIVLAGAGEGFCSGYDLKDFAEASGERPGSQLGGGLETRPWDPMADFFGMYEFTQQFMSLWRSYKPTIAKVHGPAVAGGSDIALCCDLVVMAEEAVIGYPPARVWGCPTTAMWVYRLGAEKAKRLLLTGDLIDGREAARLGLVLEAVPRAELDARVAALAERIVRGAEEPADDAEDDGEPGVRRDGTREHAAIRDAVRRHHATYSGRRLVQAARRGGGVQAGGEGTRRRGADRAGCEPAVGAVGRRQARLMRAEAAPDRRPAYRGKWMDTNKGRGSGIAALDAATLCGAFQVTAAARPDELALRTLDGAVSYTYAQYAARVRSLAAGLHSLGVRPGRHGCADAGQPAGVPRRRRRGDASRRRRLLDLQHFEPGADCAPVP